MTSAMADHTGPWTEAEYFALDESPNRIELFDGSLHVTPAPTPRHQIISRRLASLLDVVTTEAASFVLEAVNVRLRPGLVAIPDVVVTEPIDVDEAFVPVAAVWLVCEITSPGNASTDRVLKMHHYAAAGIPWYLLVEQETGTLRLCRLDGDKYREHAVAEPGEKLTLTDPVYAEIDGASLLDI
jgi:Uma2 family endonuclease